MISVGWQVLPNAGMSYPNAGMPLLWEDHNAWADGFAVDPVSQPGVSSFGGKWADPRLGGDSIPVLFGNIHNACMNLHTTPENFWAGF